jgi:multidrug efflux system membrane fusion protein
VDPRLLIETKRNAVIIPEAAVQRTPQGTFAYVVKSDSTVENRDIVLGPVEADERAIESGLSAGEVVVIEGVDKLQPGSKVSTRSAGGSGKAAGAGKGGAQSGAPGAGAAAKKRKGE